MILVDSSIWIDFFNGNQSPEVDFFRNNLGKLEFLIGDLILAEVLQGVRDESAFNKTRRLLEHYEVVQLCDAEIAIQAARNYRYLRSQGITVRKTIDTIIATRCIEDDYQLLHRDRDFDGFVMHLGLRVPSLKV